MLSVHLTVYILLIKYNVKRITLFNHGKRKPLHKEAKYLTNDERRNPRNSSFIIRTEYKFEYK